MAITRAWHERLKADAPEGKPKGMPAHQNLREGCRPGAWRCRTGHNDQAPPAKRKEEYMRKVLLFIDCCGYCMYFNLEKNICWHSEAPEHSVLDSMSIPLWCPLPNARDIDPVCRVCGDPLTSKELICEMCLFMPNADEPES